MDPRAALERLAGTVRGLEAVDVTSLPAAELNRCIVSLHAVIDRLRVVEARALHASEQSLAWVGAGSRNAVDWLATATNSSGSDATRVARLGDVLTASPGLAEAISNGTLSVGVAEAVAPTLTDPKLGEAASDDLLPRLSGATPREAKRTAEAWVAAQRSREDDDAQRVRAQSRRFVRFNSAADGSISGSFSLPTMDGRAVRQALEHLAGAPVEADRRTGEQRLADALVALGDAYARGQVAGGRERPTALILVSDAVADGSAQGAATTSFDDIVADIDLRRTLCDCELHRVVLRARSTVVDFGRRARTVSRAQWLALVARDRRCRWPGCAMPPGWCDAHHVKEWIHHGLTDLANLVLLCRHHHTTVHLPGHGLSGTATQLAVTLPDGSTLHSPPPSHAVAGESSLDREQVLFATTGGA